MTVATIKKSEICLEGHAGNSFVCSGISGMMQMTANYAEDHKMAYVDCDSGYMRIYDIDPEQRENELFKALEEALEKTAEVYPDNLIVKRA